MTRRPLFTVALAALMVLALVAVAAASTKSKSKTVTVAAGKTRTATVAYPNALQQGGAKYKCSAKVVDGDADMVTITKGSAQGGSVCQAKIKNKSSDDVSVKITAKTTT
jgi:hypothetical protein